MFVKHDYEQKLKIASMLAFCVLLSLKSYFFQLK